MRVMVMVKASKESESGVMPGGELLEAMGKYNEELAKAGVMLAADGLRPSSKGARVQFAGVGRPIVTEGPFAEPRELVAGFWIWKVKSMDEAVEWIKRSPFGPGAELEIRPFHEMEDFGPAATPEFLEQTARLRAQVEKNSKGEKAT
jgi:hypothetical protein